MENTKDVIDDFMNNLKEDNIMAKPNFNDNRGVTPNASSSDLDKLITDATADNNSANDLDKLIEGATEDIKAEEAASQARTSEFSNPDADSMLKGAATNEEKQAQKNRETATYNNIVSSKKITQLKSLRSDVFSAEKTAFQTACQQYFRLVALITPEGPSYDFAVSEKPLKTPDNTDYIYRDGISDADKDKVKSKTKGVVRANFVKCSAELTYKGKKPGKCIGGIIQAPQCLFITSVEFNRADFKAPTPAQIAASPVVTRICDFNTLHTYISLFCNGKIYEADHVRESAVAKHNSVYNLVSRTKEKYNKAKGTTTTDFTIEATNRPTNLRENIIPINHTEMKPIAQLTAEEKANISGKLQKAFGAAKNRTNTKYSNLNPKFANIVSANVGSDGRTLENFQVNLEPGLLASVGLVATSWCNCTKTPGKLEFETLTDYPTALYTKHVSEKTGAISYKRSIKRLSGDFGLQDISAEYPAAGVALSCGISTDDVMEVYNQYTLAKKAESASRRGTTSGRAAAVKRVDSAYSNEEQARIALDMIMNNDATRMSLDKNAYAPV